MPAPIHLAQLPDGTLTYAIPLPPEALPAVAPQALLSAWDMARDGAARECWGPRRLLAFRRTDGGTTEIAIADPDAGCWAEAIDASIGLDTLDGLALCLRLLALVEVLTRADWLAGLFDVTLGGVELHPKLLAAAARMPLDAAARFDEGGLRRLLSPRLTESPRNALPPGGAA